MIKSSLDDDSSIDVHTKWFFVANVWTSQRIAKGWFLELLPTLLVMQLQSRDAL